MRFSVAPMLDWTDKHCRYFYRLLSTKSTLWTEMITTNAILFGDKNRLLDFDDTSNKTVLQLGGSDVNEMLECTKIAQDFGYREVNINVGCPSDRVQSGSFGACLMKTPEIVAENVAKMQEVGVKISVKHRIGVDDIDGYENLYNFVNIVKNAGCDDFIIHSRKALLKGLSPKENRTVPPLDYSQAYKIKEDFPKLNITINGGIKTLDDCQKHLQFVDGTMLGREAYHNPFLLSCVDEVIYNKADKSINREQILGQFIVYLEKQIKGGVPIRSMTRHILGLYHAQPNSKKFKRMLSGKIVKLEDLKEWCNA